MSTKDNALWLGFFLAGAAVGAAVALLVAPGSGKETRKFLSRSLEDGVDFLEEKGKDISRRTEGILEKGKGLATKFVS